LETDRVRLDEECRDIEEGLAAIPNRPIAFKSKWSVRVQDLQRALLEESPSLVHISAHGDEYGRMLLESPSGGSEPMEFGALREFFRVFRGSVRCVVLSYCDSDDQARELSVLVDCVIGMKGTVSVGAALAFSTSFYQALAFGKDIATAFELGRVQKVPKSRRL
jgi:CHAT domain